MSSAAVVIWALRVVQINISGNHHTKSFRKFLNLEFLMFATVKIERVSLMNLYVIISVVKILLSLIFDMH